MWFGGTAVPLWRRLLAGAGGLGSGIALFSWVNGSSLYKITPVIVAIVMRARVPAMPPRVRAIGMTGVVLLLVALAGSRVLLRW